MHGHLVVEAGWGYSLISVPAHNRINPTRQQLTDSGPLDILAVDEEGTLVVIELKNEAYDGHPDQGLRYHGAASASVVIDAVLSERHRGSGHATGWGQSAALALHLSRLAVQFRADGSRQRIAADPARLHEQTFRAKSTLCAMIENAPADEL